MKKIISSLLTFFLILSCSTVVETSTVENETALKLKSTISQASAIQSIGIGLPSEIANLYENSPNCDVSDDFDSLDWSKWTYRTENTPADWATGSEHVKIVDNSYLSIKGDYEPSFSTGSGLSALNKSKYGFYVTRWRHSGSTTGWHDAIWTAGRNFGETPASLPNLTNINRIEIDIFERNWMSPAKWNAKVHGWGPNGVHEAKVLRPDESGTEWTDWTIDAVEYHPDYIRAWKYRDGTWTSFDKIYFTTSNTGDNLHMDFREENYAIISIKKGVKNTQYPVSDAWMHVDYYMVYDLI